MKTQTSFSKVVSGFIIAPRVADRFTPARITELQSGQVSRPARPGAQKKDRIRRPKGSKWCLMDEMGLAHDEDKYKRIIVRFFHFPDIHEAQQTHNMIAEVEELEERGGI